MVSSNGICSWVFAADGCITVNKRGGQYWCIQIADKALLQSIRNSVGSNHSIGVRLREKPTENTHYRLQIGSIEMCNDLRELGFAERKTKNMTIPSVPQEYLSSFVRGYFDGDGNVWFGYVHKKRKTMTPVVFIGFTSGSKGFLEIL